MIELTEEQHAAVQRGENRVRDPATDSTYVLVHEDAYNRLHDLIEMGPLTLEERKSMMRGAWDRAGWSDPRMDDYDALPEAS